MTQLIPNPQVFSRQHIEIDNGEIIFTRKLLLFKYIWQPNQRYPAILQTI